jgi:enamine deaminase RidA (YjgF/YER057c/UK114 family)
MSIIRHEIRQISDENRGQPIISQAVVHGNVAYFAGITPNPIVGDIKTQTAQVLRRVDELLELAGTDKSQLLSAQVHLVARFQTEALGAWQNGLAERLIGSIRRDCLDHVVVFNERHLRHFLNSYKQYYNEFRTHLSLDKDAPIRRDAQRVGRVLPLPILGGLHHQYVRI